MRLKPIPAAIQTALICLLPMGITHASDGYQNAAPSDNHTSSGQVDTLPAVQVRDKLEPESATGPVRGYTATRSATATKTDIPVVEIPQSISIVGSQFIKERAESSIQDSIAYTPGVSLLWGTDSRADSLSLRGFSVGRPGHFMDGFSTFTTEGYSRHPFSNAYNAERIEVLRGPSSSLYGLSQPGGFVNIISKRPAKGLEQEIRFQMGDHGHRQVATDLSGKLSNNESLLYRFVGLVQDSQVLGGGLPNDQVLIAPSIKWEPDASTSFTIITHYAKQKTASSSASLPVEGTLLPNPNGQIPFHARLLEDIPNFYNKTQWSLGYEFTKKLNPSLKFEQSARYGKIGLDYQQPWSNASFEIVDEQNPSSPENFRKLKRSVFFDDEETRFSNLDTRIQGEMNRGKFSNKITAGFDIMKTNLDITSGFGGEISSIDVFTRASDGRYTLPPVNFIAGVSRPFQRGIYIQNSMKYENTSVLLTARYDKYRFKKHDKLDQKILRDSSSKTTGRVGLSHDLGNGLIPYASYSSSFVPVLQFDSDTGRAFKPETSRQIEIGVKHQPKQGEFGYNLAFYDLRRQNYVTTDPETNRSRQTGEVVSRGFEAEAFLRPTPFINILAAYTLSTKFEVTKSSNPDEIGKPLDQGFIRHQASVWTDYRFPTGFKIGLGVRYIGSHRGDLNSLPSKVPSYALYDASISYDHEKWRFSLNARNLTNKRTLGYCASWGCDYGDPRRLLATASYLW